jgi:peptidoglycan/xylan/chitin deacetylase (PgdA/CDA1 family)
MRRVILIFAAVAPFFAIALLFAGRPWLGITILASSHVLLLVPTLVPNAQWLGPVVTRFSTDAKEVWLTIDDGPTDDTPAILDALNRHGTRATFFLKGDLAGARPELVRAILAHGHTVGNHSQTHPSGSFWCLPPTELAREIDACNSVLGEMTGTPPALFRAPVGMKNPFVHPLLKSRGLTLVGWTIRGFDAVSDRGDEVPRRVVERLEPGAIIVLHQGRTWSAATMSAVVERVQERGYRFVIPEAGRLNTNR